MVQPFISNQKLILLYKFSFAYFKAEPNLNISLLKLF